jgi:hypothetical protein
MNRLEDFLIFHPLERMPDLQQVLEATKALPFCHLSSTSFPSLRSSVGFSFYNIKDV